MKTRRILAFIAALVAALAFHGVQAQEHPSSAMPAAATNDILTAAAADTSLSTFVAAVKAAGLTEKLSGKGPFTVFAPTNAAFARLPKGELDDLMAPANKARLAGMLACHVVPGQLAASAMKTMKATNVSGQDLDIEVHDGAMMVDSAHVVGGELKAANGVIHKIDMVIMPKEAPAPETAKPKDHPGH